MVQPMPANEAFWHAVQKAPTPIPDVAIVVSAAPKGGGFSIRLIDLSARPKPPSGAVHQPWNLPILATKGPVPFARMREAVDTLIEGLAPNKRMGDLLVFQEETAPAEDNRPPGDLEWVRLNPDTLEPIEGSSVRYRPI